MISLNIPLGMPQVAPEYIADPDSRMQRQNAPKKKQSRREMMEQRTAMNKARRARLNSKG